MLHNCGMSAEYEIVDICGMSNIMVCMWSMSRIMSKGCIMNMCMQGM
jgi:hypothetical protein